MMKAHEPKVNHISVRLKNWTITLFVCLSLCLLSAAQGVAQTTCKLRIRTDRLPAAEPTPVPLPPAGGTFCDPTFGTRIMRVTDDKSAPYGAGTSYSYWPTFNLNNTKILVVNPAAAHQGDIYEFNPETFTLVRRLPSLPYAPETRQAIKLDDAVWSYSDPNKLFVHADNGTLLYSYDLNGNLKLIADMARFISPGHFITHMSVSQDEKTFAFNITSPELDSEGRPIYRDAGYLVYSALNDRPVAKSSEGINEVRIDKTGRYLFVNKNMPDPAPADTIEVQIVDLETGVVENLTDGPPDHAPSHYDVGTGVAVGATNYLEGITARKMSTPHSFNQILDLTHEGNGGGFHLSMLADNESWVLVSFYTPHKYSYTATKGSPSGKAGWGYPLQRELVQVATDGSQRVRRLVHHQSIWQGDSPIKAIKEHGYYDSPRANISRDGRFIAFSSNWGRTGATTTRHDMFIAQIPPAPSSQPGGVISSGNYDETYRVNVAAAAQGATASASSVYPIGSYTASSVINGDRKGLNWGAGGGWNDATQDVFPDWLQIDFKGTKNINEVDVFTSQDDYANPSDPTETMTFTMWGLTGFEVQFWDGAAWMPIPGATVSGNNKVWRRFTFPDIATSKIRVVANSGLAGYSRLTEVEAYQSSESDEQAAASFLQSDTTTQGNWKGKYGGQGYSLVGDGVSYPAYAQVSVTGATTHIWAASTSDVRALQKAAQGSTDRIAATLYSATEYTIDLNLTDGMTHQVAMYSLDWDYNNLRAQNVQIRDAVTGALLDSRSMTNLTNGQYAVWYLRGHVRMKVTYTGPAGLNAVTSALFFDSPAGGSGGSQIPLVINNSGFENPALGTSYQYSPAGAGWTFGGGAGVAGNGSDFTTGNPAAPEGVQVAFLQMASPSTISQVISGFRSNTSYAVNFKVAQRGNYQSSSQDFEVFIDNTSLGVFHPLGINYRTITTATFTVTEGAHTLKFVGKNTNGGDNTVFLDDITVTSTSQ
jgi:hypothetical protein